MQEQQLRLWSPEAEEALATCILPSHTLTDFYQLYYRDVGLLGSRPATYWGYDQALGHWKRLTGDPRLERIDRLVFSRFVSGLLSQGLSRRTARKHALLLNAMLEEAGFPGCMTRQIRKSLRDTRGLPAGDWTPDEVAAILDACDKMATSRKTFPMKPADFWRLFILSCYYLGEHRDEVLSIRMDECDLQASHVRIPERQKTRKANYKQIHPELAAEIERTLSKRERLCPWRNWDNKEWRIAHNSRADFTRRFGRLLLLAGIPKSRRSLGTRGFRKLHLTSMAAHSFAAAQQSANHTDIAVTLGHYVSGQVQSLRRQNELDNAILALPTIHVGNVEETPINETTIETTVIS